MPLCNLLQRRCPPVFYRLQPLLRSFHDLTTSSSTSPTSDHDSSASGAPQPVNSSASLFNPIPSNFSFNQVDANSPSFAPPPIRTQGFLSAEEAAAERRRRKRRLRIEPPIQIGQRPPPPPRDPRQPDSTSALTGPRLNLHNRVQSLIRAFDLDAASKLARSAVHARVRPTVFTCNAIIAAMHRAKRYDESKALFRYFFEQNNLVPNVVSYNYLINSLCDEGNVDEALAVYRRIIAEAPFGPSHVTYRHLTKGLVDASRIEDAVDILREMLNKGHGADSLVYNNIIKGFLNLGNLERADDFFNELKERCLVYDGVVNATYMEWWFDQGKDKEAMDSYKSLLDKKYRMVPATCNVLLSVLLKYGKKEQALALFNHMLDDHTPPTFQAVNTETINIMVNECFKEGRIAEAVETFRKSGTKPRSKPFSVDTETLNNMIIRFCEIDMPAEAEKYFEEIYARSRNPDVTSFRTLIDSFLKLEQIDDALRYFAKMVDAGLRVVASYGAGVFEKLLACRKFVECFNILTTMGEKDPKPDFPIYDVVVRGLCDAGELDKCRDILAQMMSYGVGVPPTLKESVRNVFQNAGRVDEIDAILDENKWRNAPTSNHMPRQSSGSFQSNRIPSFLDKVGSASENQAIRHNHYPVQHPLMGSSSFTNSHGFPGENSPNLSQGTAEKPSWPSSQKSSWSSQGDGRHDQPLSHPHSGGLPASFSSPSSQQSSFSFESNGFSALPSQDVQYSSSSSRTNGQASWTNQTSDLRQQPSSLKQASWMNQTNELRQQPSSPNQASWMNQTSELQQPPWSPNQASWMNQASGIEQQPSSFKQASWMNQTSGLQQQPSSSNQASWMNQAGGLQQQPSPSKQASWMNQTSGLQQQSSSPKQPSWMNQTNGLQQQPLLSKQASWTNHTIGLEQQPSSPKQASWMNQTSGLQQQPPSSKQASWMNQTIGLEQQPSSPKQANWMNQTSGLQQQPWSPKQMGGQKTPVPFTDIQEASHFSQRNEQQASCLPANDHRKFSWSSQESGQTQRYQIGQNPWSSQGNSSHHPETGNFSWSRQGGSHNLPLNQQSESHKHGWSSKGQSFQTEQQSSWSSDIKEQRATSREQEREERWMPSRSFEMPDPKNNSQFSRTGNYPYDFYQGRGNDLYDLGKREDNSQAYQHDKQSNLNGEEQHSHAGFLRHQAAGNR